MKFLILPRSWIFFGDGLNGFKVSTGISWFQELKPGVTLGILSWMSPSHAPLFRSLEFVSHVSLTLFCCKVSRSRSFKQRTARITKIFHLDLLPWLHHLHCPLVFVCAPEASLEVSLFSKIGKQNWVGGCLPYEMVYIPAHPRRWTLNRASLWLYSVVQGRS